MRALLSVLYFVPVAPGVAQVAAPPPPPAAVRQAVVAARLRLDSAIAAKDTAAIAVLLAPDVFLVQRGDTVRGAPAIAAWVAAGIAGVPEVRLSYAPDAMVPCGGATLDERGGDYTLFLATYTRTDTLRGRYAARWTVGADGTARISAVELGYNLPGTRRSALRLGGGCGPLPIPSLSRRRVLLTLPTPFQTIGWNTVSSVEQTLRGRGYGSGQLPQLLTSFPTREESPPLTISARVHLKGAWSVEAYAGLGQKDATIRGYAAADSSYVTAVYDGRHGGILVGYERGIVRVGAGPAILRNRWAIEERELHATYDTAGALNGWASNGVRGTRAYSESVVGLVAQTTVVFPVSSLVFIEGRAQVRRFPGRSIPATGRLAALSANHSGYTLSLALGGAW